MAKFENLPYELISEITSLLPYSTLASLCLTSRALYIKVNPLLWRHLQLGPTTPHAFSNNRGFQVSSVLWPPYLRLCPPTTQGEKHETTGARAMDTRAILKFYTAARKGWVRNQTFGLIRSIELGDGVLRGCLEPFDNVGWWMNGEFHILFQEMAELGRFDGLTTIRIVYDRSLNTYLDISDTEGIAIKKAQDFCRTVRSFAVAHPDTQIKISTTQFALVHSLFSEKPPPSTITSLKATLSRRPETIEFFSLNVLPNLQGSLKDLTILISMLDYSTPRHLIMPLFDEYSGEYNTYVGYTFDDEPEFMQLSFPALRSVEYAAELFGFVWVPNGIQRLCIRHRTIPEVRWWKELAANEMKGLERLEVWVDCEILSYSNISTSSIHRSGTNTWGRQTEVSFRDLKSLVIASNVSQFSDSHPNMEVVEGRVRPGDDNITGIPLDITHAILDANPGLQDIFLESIDSETLETLFSRGVVRSLTIQNPWGIDTQRRYCLPFSVESLAALGNCSCLEWLHFCVRDAYSEIGISRALVELLAMYCRRLHWFVMEDRSQDATALEVNEQLLVGETETTEDLRKEKKDLIRWVRPIGAEERLLPMLNLGQRPLVHVEYFIFDLDGFREDGS